MFNPMLSCIIFVIIIAKYCPRLFLNHNSFNHSFVNDNIVQLILNLFKFYKIKFFLNIFPKSRRKHKFKIMM